ncbi:hypothetical protein D9756_000006 [Leucocoprinus leucothites]|uniref:Uncharacterized protein n=1 Tax=Leucocoprinus leucothites TaxID=201217 RepID=A0A8H5GFA9_9AGAR|nr:hypothetical protein D9756_000006 [Leucoagaricus leucothites]
MSVRITCLPANPDIFGIGVRTAIYAQNLLSFIPALFALQDGKVTPFELEASENQSTTTLIIAFAILLNVIIQGLSHGLINYQAAIILNLSWMNNTHLFIYSLLYAYSTVELGEEEIKQGGDRRTLRAFWLYRTKKVMKNPVFIVGSVHLALMSAVGIWLWAKPVAFSRSPLCSLSASLFVVGKQTSLGSQGLREWSLFIYSLLLLPGLNIIIPVGFFAVPVWALGRFSSFSLKRESMLRFARAGLAVLFIINIILLADTEVAITKNRALTAEGGDDWTFVQTLALLLLLIPMRNIGEILLERRVRKVGERLKAASTMGNVEMVRDAMKSGAPRSAIEPSITNALNKGHLDVVEILIENAGVDAVYPSLQATLAGYSQAEFDSRLYSAVRNQQLGVVRLLVKLRGGVNAINSDGQTPLHYAAENGHNDMVRALVELGANADVLDKAGRTALSLANDHGHMEVVNYLTKHCATQGLETNHPRETGPSIETVDEKSG